MPSVPHLFNNYVIGNLITGWGKSVADAVRTSPLSARDMMDSKWML